jgi:hypothetical protein
MGNKVNKKIGAYDKLQVKHSVHIMSSIIKQQSSFQFNLENLFINIYRMFKKQYSRNHGNSVSLFKYIKFCIGHLNLSRSSCFTAQINCSTYKFFYKNI